jgi:DNA-binding CsgD family transcriptional regulator
MNGRREIDGSLLERDQQMERIERSLRRAEEGQGCCLAVDGPPGMGKTALLAAAREKAEERGFRVLRARGAELEQEFAFGVVRQLFEPMLAGASQEERTRLLDGPPQVAARLLGLPGLGEATAVDTEVAPDPSFAVLHGLYWLCANLATDCPLALVVDDSHWADGASIRFLAFLLPRLEELHMAVLLGARSGEAGERRELLASLMVDAATEVATVGPLTTEAVAALIAVGLGAEPDTEFAAACRHATGGTPFLVQALVEALREEGITPISQSATMVPNVATETLSRWTMLRLLRLGPDAARLARAMAILESAEIDQVARLADLAPNEAAKAADVLVRNGILEDGPPLGFVHPLLRGAVYRDIGVAERGEAHGRAARLLAEDRASPARVAEHLLATAPVGDDWVVEHLRAAGREAMARGAPESAAAYLRRAVAEPPVQKKDGALLLELGRAEFSAGQSGWHDHLEGAVEAAGNDTTRTAAALLFANALRFHQRLAEAVEVCDRVAARVDDRDTEGHLLLEAMAVASGIIDTAIAPSLSIRAGVLIVRAKEQSVPRLLPAVAALAAAMANQPADQVADLARRAIAAGGRPLPEPGEPPWFQIAMAALHWAERYDEAQALLDAAVTEAQRTANGTLLPAVLAERAWLALRRGDLTAAEADARALLTAPGRSAPLMYGLLATGVLVDVLVEQGLLGHAEQALETLLPDLYSTTLTAAFLRHARGHLRFAQRRFDEALGDFRALGEVTSGVAPAPCWLPWRSDAALSALALGQSETARRLSDEELRLARAFGARRAIGVALRAAGLVAGGQTGQTLLREAVEVLDGPDTRLEQARALTDLGALLRRGNSRVAARQLLREALDSAHHLGAADLAQRAETELRATGAKPRRVLLSGLEALTASERRIAELAAEGLTNREIAQCLFVTARTVEGHLTNVFQKLDVKTRTSLTDALAAPTQAARA